MDEILGITEVLDKSRLGILMALVSGELCLCRVIELLELAPSTMAVDRAGAMDLFKAVELANQRRQAVGIAEEPRWEHQNEIGCRLADEGVSSRPCPPEWSIHRATEADRLTIALFRSAAIVMADGNGVDADARIDTRVAQNDHGACPAWIAEDSERIVGVIMVTVSGPLLAGVAGLWVDPSMRNSRVPADLLGCALRFCWDTGILKVVLSTHLPEDETWAVFSKCGFNIARDRQQEGRNVRDFYVDLYKQADCRRSEA